MSVSQAESLPTTVTLGDVAATNAFAGKCASIARAGDVFALAGALGVGKTTFARAFVNAMADREGAPPEEVPSPTFTLVQLYEFGSETVYHFDLYRIESEADAMELGIDEAFADGISLIEWPEKLGGYLPSDRVELSFDFGDDSDQRLCRVRGYGAWSARAAELLPDG